MESVWTIHKKWAILEIFKKYATNDVIEYLKKSNKFNLEEITNLLEMLNNKYSKKFGSLRMGLIVDEKTNDVEFINIIFPKGSWEEWGELAKKIKKEMKESGYGHLCSKVAIVCLQGLIE